MNEYKPTKRTAEELLDLAFDIRKMLEEDARTLEHYADVKNEPQDYYDAQDLKDYALQLDILLDKISSIVRELRP